MSNITKIDTSNATSNGNKRKRKKTSSKQQPQAKRTRKSEEFSPDEEYQQRFKFVLAPKSNDSTESDAEAKQHHKKKKKLSKLSKIYEDHETSSGESWMEDESDSTDDGEELDIAGQHQKKKKAVNGKKISKLTKAYENNESSSDDSWTDEEFESLTDDEECEEEWETDTDYLCDEETDSDEYSFHESDCEEVDSDDYVEGSDDPDYSPPVQDKYIKKGDAIIYDAKGLDFAFGDCDDSKIMEITDLDAGISEYEECVDNIPKLITPDGMEIDETPASTPAAPKAQKKEKIEEEEILIENSLLLQRVTFYECISDQGVIIKLNKTIHFFGIIDIHPLINSVQINGYKISTGKTLTASSISHADYQLNLTPVINENTNDFDEEKLKGELKNLLPQTQDVNDLFQNFDHKKDVLIHLQRSPPNSAVEMLKNYCSFPILPHKNTLLKNSPSPSSELTLHTKFFSCEENSRINCYRINEDWKYIEMKKESKIVVVGGKNVGKSAFTQYMINSNVEKFGKILLIDLDIGQPICGVAQTVSATLISKPLIGAGYLSKVDHEKSFFYGDKSIMISPFKYVECVRRLVKHCNEKKELRDVPWVCNSMGYQKGFGLQLMTLLIRILQPTDVVQIQHSNVKYNYQNILNENFINTCSFSFFNESHLQDVPKNAFFITHVLDSLVNNNINRDNGSNEWVSNATEKRKMSLLSQLSKLMCGGQTYLNEVIPFCIPINRIRLLVMDEEYENTRYGEAANLDIINGNLVYLCHSDDIDDDVSLPLDANSILECFAVGLVRAIDKIHGLIYVLMPQHDGKLRSVINVMAIGNIPLPSEILLKQNFGVEGNIPNVTFFKDRNMKKYINKRNIKDCF